MRLVDLDPRWVGAGGAGVIGKDGHPAPERHGVGVMCRCPCGCANDLYVQFANPIDGAPWDGGRGWTRTGDTFDTLTLRPSILRDEAGGCGWHGFITKGEVTTC